ncbi:hypothetical protein [Streptacidiphilus neutrinimicus]|uniref:hypothetical protein n=1 Tax=Streptacidiphilus neutrinimicus TaxID=105420 RepID=UPI00069410D2|nr:hypothetical protein [Streptacidiphilus neutrinimicus]
MTDQPLIQPDLPDLPDQPDQQDHRDQQDDRTPAPTPASSGRRLTVGALGLAFVLSAVGVGAFVGLGLRSPAAAKPATAAARAATPSFGAHSDGDHYGSLGDLLLPIPAGYQYGPDDMGLGDDSVLTPSQYEAMYTKSFAFLSSGERQQLKNELDLAHVLGYGLRTYSDSSSQVVEITLLQENQHTAKGWSQVGKELADATNALRAGPSIPGHPEAHCYLLPTRPGDPLDSMGCEAAVGDLLVSLDAEGTAPLDQRGAAAILEAQLNRLAIPAAQI